MSARLRNLMALSSVLALLSVAVVSGVARGEDDEDTEDEAKPAAAAVKAAPGQIDDPRDVLSRYPKLQAQPRTPHLEEAGVFPCSDCHDPDMMESNPIVRKLEDDHDKIVLEHGGGRFWCLTCHHDADRDKLRSLKGQPIDFDESHLLCGQCHFQRQRDFFHGAHGKRLESWRGERKVLACTACHDAHAPKMKPRKPYRADRLREGLLTPYRPTGHPALFSTESDHGER